MWQGESKSCFSLTSLTALRIIEPLASRCSKFRFTPLDSTSTSSRLSYIASAENIDVTPEVISTLIETSGGDLRRSITYLQSASRLSSSTNPPVPITPHDIQEIAGVVPTAVINDFARTLGVPIVEDMDIDDLPANGKLKGFNAVQKKVKGIMREGYSASQTLSQVSDSSKQPNFSDIIVASWHYYSAPDAACTTKSTVRSRFCRSWQGSVWRCWRRTMGTRGWASHSQSSYHVMMF